MVSKHISDQEKQTKKCFQTWMKLDHFRPDKVPAPRNEVVDELMINLKVAISYSHLNLIFYYITTYNTYFLP